MWYPVSTKAVVVKETSEKDNKIMIETKMSNDCKIWNMFKTDVACLWNEAHARRKSSKGRQRRTHATWKSTVVTQLSVIGKRPGDMINE